MDRPTLALIAAVARNGAIGKDNRLLWQEPEDQKHFRRITLGHPVIMGRKTWDSLPARFRPLPGRRNVVLSRDETWQSPGAERAGSLQAALDLLEGIDTAFVIGGAALYAQTLPLAQRLVLTEIDADLPGDAFFPPFDRGQFSETASPRQLGAAGLAYRFVTYLRKVAAP